MTNLLTGNTHDTEFFPHLSKSEQDAILQLRSLVPQLLTSEKTALVILMTDSYARSSGRLSWVNVRADRGFGSDLTNIVFLISKLSPASKRLIAIELLVQAPTEEEEEEEEEDEENDDGYGDELYAPVEETDLTRVIAEINSPEAQEDGGDHYYQPSFSVAG
ncbi:MULTISPECIES: hypothetical protein [unclassified Microcoleus]|uniref:hypothetical protein n=1 Tax=unclassified Microcoleus TaxID=2642155 RepID=UPI002FD1C154